MSQVASLPFSGSTTVQRDPVYTMHEDAERKGRPQLDVVLIVLITFVPHAAPDVGILDFKF